MCQIGLGPYAKLGMLLVGWEGTMRHQCKRLDGFHLINTMTKHCMIDILISWNPTIHHSHDVWRWSCGSILNRRTSERSMLPRLQAGNRVPLFHARDHVWAHSPMVIHCVLAVSSFETQNIASLSMWRRKTNWLIYIYIYIKYVMDDSDISDLWTSPILLERAYTSHMSLSSISYSIYQMWHWNKQLQIR